MPTEPDVHVRLVPKTRTGVSRAAAGTILTPYNTSSFAADPERATRELCAEMPAEPSSGVHRASKGRIS